jgi:hypothetical protein
MILGSMALFRAMCKSFLFLEGFVQASNSDSECILLILETFKVFWIFSEMIWHNLLFLAG